MKAKPGYTGQFLTLGATCMDGYCRFRMQHANDECDCVVRCQLETTSGRLLSCIDGKCKAAACAACGQKPNDLQCCAPGIVSHGKCYCATGVGEGCATNPDKYGEDFECCARGTDNEGFYCGDNTCNGKCIQPSHNS